MNFEASKTPSVENGPGEKKTLILGEDGVLEFEIEVVLGENGEVKEVLRDIYRDDIYSVDDKDFKKAIKSFVDAGVALEYEPWRVSRDPQDGTPHDISGWIEIKKENINKAIKEARLKLMVSESGEIEL